MTKTRTRTRELSVIFLIAAFSLIGGAIGVALQGSSITVQLVVIVGLPVAATVLILAAIVRKIVLERRAALLPSVPKPEDASLAGWRTCPYCAWGMVPVIGGECDICRQEYRPVEGESSQS